MLAETAFAIFMSGAMSGLIVGLLFARSAYRETARLLNRSRALMDLREDRAWYDYLVRKGEPPRATTEQIIRAILAYAAEREAAAYARAAEVAQSEADDIHQHAHLKTDPWQMGRAAMASTIATAILSLKEGKG